MQTVLKKVAAHCRDIRNCKGNFGNKIRRRVGFRHEKSEFLIGANAHTKISFRGRAIRADVQSKSFAVEIVRMRKVRGVEPYKGDPRDTRSQGFTSHQSGKAEKNRTKKESDWFHLSPSDCLLHEILSCEFRRGAGVSAARSPGRSAGIRCGRRGCRG